MPNFSAVTEETKGLIVNVCAQQGTRSTFAVKGLEKLAGDSRQGETRSH